MNATVLPIQTENAECQDAEQILDRVQYVSLPKIDSRIGPLEHGCSKVGTSRKKLGHGVNVSMTLATDMRDPRT